ncbi:MAG: hydroxymethylglutaryl-CoA lyase [Flavobacteriales bacterium]|nr:hydroxymethylglutaryl-CoA lyase [Flavobacteriales bacterium]|tara:strand:- start:4659 stop:5522 length:864 start_codon:yes stop_codon:yes gene_type:complete
MSRIKVIECPRDAMQGVKKWIPTKNKISYIQSLLNVGFDVLDVGSFVSKRSIPQMKDSRMVLESLNLSSTTSKLLYIVANLRGALEACVYPEIDFLGFPFSVSENFQMRNTNKTINQSLEELKKIISVCNSNDKEVVVYLSMGFGNPYGDEWNYEVLEKWISVIKSIGVKTISISDTIGVANPKNIDIVFKNSIKKFHDIEFGAHFHTKPSDWFEKIDSAYKAGCRRFDTSIQGYGGCPMAADELTGNFPTEKLITYMNQIKVNININSLNFESSYNETTKFFSDYN